MMEEVNPIMIYCKNFSKCHNVPPYSYNMLINVTLNSKEEILTVAHSWATGELTWSPCLVCVPADSLQKEVTVHVKTVIVLCSPWLSMVVLANRSYVHGILRFIQFSNGCIETALFITYIMSISVTCALFCSLIFIHM
jgi:hypothetical protein